MSLSASVGTQIPTNVVEVGNEISQNSINALAAASSPATLNPFMTSNAVSATYATRVSPTFTGTVTIPAGASITGYLTTSLASGTYQTISGMTNYLTTSSASTIYQTQAGMSSYLTDAPSNGNEYVRKNAAWAVATGGGGATAASQLTNATYTTNPTAAPTTAGDVLQFNGTALVWAAGGGGGGISDAPTGTGLLYARRAGGGGNVWEDFTIPTVPPASVTNIDLTGNFNGYSMGSGNYTFKFDSTANTLRMQDGSGSGITISTTGITFPDSTTLSTAPGSGGSGKTVNVQSSNWTLNAGDTNNIVFLNGVNGTLTIPDNASYSFPVGTHIMVATSGCTASVVPSDTMTPAPTILGSTTLATTGINHLIKVSTDTWVIE